MKSVDADAHYDVQTLYVFRGDDRRAVGHTVRVYAPHPDEPGGLAGCPRCHALWASLKAEIEPKLDALDGRARWGVRPFDRCLHVARDGQEEVELTIEVRAEEDQADPLAEEAHAVDEICAALEQLGLTRGSGRSG